MPVGSYLYRLRRAKTTNDTRLAARDYARDSLRWLITDGVASAIDVQTSWQGVRLNLEIAVTQQTGPTRHFAFAWDQL
ncbi:MAG: hypothetical protein NVSMB20_18850 [Bradyrhizobium sp.]